MGSSSTRSHAGAERGWARGRSEAGRGEHTRVEQDRLATVRVRCGAGQVVARGQLGRREA